MPCTKNYVDPTEAPMGQAKTKGHAHDKNLPTHQLHSAIALREHMPLKNRKWFQRLLKFSKQVA